MFVIVRHSDGDRFDGHYVAMDGSQHSYTKRLEEAKVFNTREAAKREACGNESVRGIEEVIGR